jgi:RNA polymerase sigma-70 factor (ECF subfamily)
MDFAANQPGATARQDDRASVGQLIEQYYERIYAFLRRLAGNETDAADLTQRTFIRLQQALPSFAGRSSVGSWIHGIAYHIYIDWRRSNHRTEPRSDEWWAACPSRQISPDEAAADADWARILYASVDQLDADLRDSVHFHYYQGLTLQETADAMDVATSTVKYRLRQALGQLQKRLASQLAENKSPSNLKAI